MQVQIGKNKYKVTLPIIIFIGAIFASSISWFISLQVNMTVMQQDIESLNQKINNEKSK